MHTPSGIRSDHARYGADINVAEADALIEALVECHQDPRYAGMSFGVISLLSSSKQAFYLQRQLLDQLGEVAHRQRQLKVGEAYAFQGAERDVMFVSTVVTPNERFGAFADESAHRRVNVTASRAREQVWIFHSAKIADFSPSDIRRDWLQYATSGVAAPAHRERLEDACDSGFERQVLAQVLARGYSPIPQYRIGHFRIDLVVPLPDGSRIAIECDGDAYHQDVEKDAPRQEFLQRVGDCTFFRVRGSVFGRDPGAALEPLWRLLDSRGALRWQDDAVGPVVTDAPGGVVHHRRAPVEEAAAPATVRAGAPQESEPAAPPLPVRTSTAAIDGEWDDAPAPEPVIRAIPRQARDPLSDAVPGDDSRRGTVTHDVPLPEGYRLGRWIRPVEAMAALAALRERADAPVLDEGGRRTGTVRFHLETSPEAAMFRAQVQVVRHGALGDRTVVWLREDEALAVLQAMDLERSVETSDGRSAVEYYEPGSDVGLKYRSPTRLLRRSGAARTGAIAGPNG